MTSALVHAGRRPGQRLPGRCEAPDVTEAIGALPGVQRVSVDLEPKGASTVHVEAAEPLGDDEVQAALAEEGNYSLLR